ncbi:3-oxoacyl-[acyl-carrier-protein] reductase [Bhargavaea beijingensis]|uniref:3-oxoacyl-[acyl-carrier-protein] reductase n=1 Tax=Bhargavaea beijingensis TaxID=426756 RepID=A0A1G7CBX4_9BACL|nr:3-oxoacyl-[acyl-carrier-protein] reductase [Bhargavaea beijingensis]MCW1926906.1 3-oxoacyl-[acyl-carrier-protein] reductase [Bhargavaea beijingensis]RSK36850.1 3-oxoacyl-[acyl-carrier-protein] reductase [Bhargavaea beijingensis]SDE36240.1 3-oxoacyl-[acyl-carrier-protein] reductase [Bhargavaea beijingensis]
MGKLTGKSAIVTGASRGIGRAIAIALAKEGAKVAVNFAGSEDKAAETVRMIEETGGEAFAVRASVSSQEDVKQLVDETMERFGSIDILVNNAGITKDNLLMRMKEEEWDDVLSTNLKGVFLCTKAVARPMMKKRSGTIVNLASVVGVAGNAGQANYVAAKAGVIGLTKTAAKELATRGIRVNAVAPGFITTDMTDKLPEEVKEAMMSQIPLGKLGDPVNVARAVVFLASDDSAYITGQTLHVDGGMVM